MHWVRYFLCSGNCKSIQIRSRRKTLDYSEKHILKYLKRTRNYILVYSSGSLGILMDSDFQGDIDSSKIAYEENLVDPFTKSLPERVFEKHVNCTSLRSVQGLL